MERVAAAISNVPENIFMGSSLMLTRLEIESSADVRGMVEAKAESLRRVFIDATIDEINKRGWASL